MRSHPLITACLSPFALSNRAILWATCIGGFGTLVLVPGPTTAGLFSLQWLAVVVASQAILALALIGVRLVRPEPSPTTVFATLFIGGALRGAVVAVGSGLVGVHELTWGACVSRSLNSAIITVIGIGLIGGTIAWRHDFATQYQLLRSRATELQRAHDDGSVIAPEILQAWSTIKLALDDSLRQACDRLAIGATEADLIDAAQLITRSIDIDLRPASRAMWNDAIPDADPVRLPSLLAQTLRTWRLPLREVLLFLAVVVGVGSVVRSGLVDGGLYTIRYLAVTALVLWLSTALARALPTAASVVAVITLVALPVLLLIADQRIGLAVLHTPADSTGQLVVAIATPISAVFITMAVDAVRRRREVLESLQVRIDAEAAALLARDSGVARDARRLSVFMHHSVQSELSALAMQLTEAATTHDASTVNSVRLSVLDKLERVVALDPDQPPWLQSESGLRRILEVVDAWRGILSIDMTLPDWDACRADQWLVAEKVIEEGLANSMRHGSATRVIITGTMDREDLLLDLVDDGTRDIAEQELASGVSAGTANRAGLGLQWLERVAPGDWQLQQSERGTRLSLRIR